MPKYIDIVFYNRKAMLHTFRRQTPPPTIHKKTCKGTLEHVGVDKPIDEKSDLLSSFFLMQTYIVHAQFILYCSLVVMVML